MKVLLNRLAPVTQARLLLPLLLLSLFLTGCTSFTTSVKRAEIAAVTVADASMVGWAHYYVQAQKDPGKYGTTPDQLAAQRARFDGLAIKTGMAANVVDTLLASYQTNGVGKVDVQATLSLLASNSALIVQEIKTLVNK